MNFTAPFFFLFLFIAIIVFRCLPENCKKWWLLLCSYAFYGFCSVPFLALLVGSTSIDYWLSKNIERNRASTKIKNICLVIGVLTNLSILFLFKYLNFSLDIYYETAKVFYAGIQPPAHLNLLLPLGISFFTFEAISYLVDVYRGKNAARDFFTYNFYIMYFPHLLAGPIVRFNQIVKQYEFSIHNPTLSTMIEGFKLALFGYFFKIVIANHCAIVTDDCFDVMRINPLRAWLGCTAFLVQLYFDFLGYTHIARGISLQFNISLPINFDHPFNITNIAETWQKWHITLTKWMRDYLFIPLSRGHESVPRRSLNLLIVMLAVGAWHGANLTFIAFGATHGIFLIIHYLWSKIKKKVLSNSILKHPLYSIGCAVLTILSGITTMAFFRSQTIEHALKMYSNLVHPDQCVALIVKECSEQNYTTVALLLLLFTCLLSGPLV